MVLRSPSASYLAVILSGLLVAPGILAAVDKAVLKLNGQPVATFGRKACKNAASEKVEVVLPDSATKGNNDFRALISPVKQGENKAKSEALCDQKITDSARLDIKLAVGSVTIPLDKFLSTGDCGPKATPGSRVLCIYDVTGGTLLAYSIFDYDTTQAKIESITERSATNGEVSFKVKTSGASGGKIRVCFGKTSEGKIEADDCPDPPFREKDYTPPDIKITGLENDVEYGFKVKLIDDKDGESEWSEPFTETPIQVASPLAGYNGRGSQVQFSCQQSGQGSIVFVVLALFMLLLVRARIQVTKTVHGLVTILLLATLSPNESHADFGQMNIGLLGAMYRPDLDSEKTSSGDPIFPFYKCFFRKKTSDKNGPINPLMGAELDWHLWDKFGSLQFGFGASYTFTTGRALRYDANGEPDCDAPVDNAKVSLHMYQLRPQLTYLFNPFAEYFPLVPYIRGALIGHGYMFFSGGKNETPVNHGGTTIKPNGFRFGYQGALGMMLMLDFLEPSAVTAARGQGLFEHVYLKGELSITKIDSFGRPGFQFSAKDVMGTNWPLMWTFGLVFELP